jgi:hypothetical protein
MRSDMSKIRNKSAYFSGVISRFKEETGGSGGRHGALKSPVTGNGAHGAHFGQVLSPGTHSQKYSLQCLSSANTLGHSLLRISVSIWGQRVGLRRRRSLRQPFRRQQRARRGQRLAVPDSGTAGCGQLCCRQRGSRGRDSVGAATAAARQHAHGASGRAPAARAPAAAAAPPLERRGARWRVATRWRPLPFWCHGLWRTGRRTLGCTAASGEYSDASHGGANNVGAIVSAWGTALGT